MKCLLILSVVAFLAAVQCQMIYKMDDIDFEEIMKNERLYKKYFMCVIGQGKCTPDGKDLKDAIPDALATSCSKCSDKLKQQSNNLLRYIMEKKQEDYDQLEKLYDPTGAYRKNFKAK